jgi:putative aminopeptidase FrvX
MSVNANDQRSLDLFSDLLTAPSPSGREERVARIIFDKVEAWGYSPEIDAAGNVLVRLEGRDPEAPLTCVAAHMDEIGMVVTNIRNDGSLLVNRSGGLKPWKFGEGPVTILGDEEDITGVLSFGSTHTKGGSGKAIEWDQVWVMTGLSPEQLATAGVRPGSTAVPVQAGRGPVVFGDPADPMVAAWTFDDRMGCVAMLRTLEILKETGGQAKAPTVLLFTVREEEGGFGAKAYAQRERPVIFVSIDGCPIPPGSPLKLDGRPGIWSQDSHAHYDQALLLELCSAARDAGTELQPVVFEVAASDASMVFTAGATDRIACFGHPRENSHGYEVARLSVFENVAKTLVAYLIAA